MPHSGSELLFLEEVVSCELGAIPIQSHLPPGVRPGVLPPQLRLCVPGGRAVMVELEADLTLVPSLVTFWLCDLWTHCVSLYFTNSSSEEWGVCTFLTRTS